MKQGNRHKEKCCGNCHWFDNEDVYGVGWCSNNEHVSSCGQVCDEHESKRWIHDHNTQFHWPPISL